MTQIVWHSDQGWTQGNSVGCLALPGRVISLVGGGGKTTLLYHLAADYQAKGKRTTVMTTTKIYRPDHVCTTWQECEGRWAAGQYAVCGQAVSPEKLGPPSPPLLAWLLEHADIVLIEADGARHMACKIPADHEPVLLPQSDTVIAVLGLDALGQPVGQVCFRPELVCNFLGCGMDHRLTREDFAKILLSPQGSRKDVGQRDYHVVLNKCDKERRLTEGQALVTLLESLGHTQTYLTRFR